MSGKSVPRRNRAFDIQRREWPVCSIRHQHRAGLSNVARAIPLPPPSECRPLWPRPVFATHCGSHAGGRTDSARSRRPWRVRLRRPLRLRVPLRSPIGFLPSRADAPPNSRTPPGSAEKSYHCSHSTVLIQPMMASRHLPSSETSIGVSPREDFSKKGPSSAACSTRSIETSRACERRQIVARVGLVSLRSI